MKRAGRYDSLEELFAALDSGAVVLTGGGIVKMHPSCFPPGYVSESWIDGYQDRYDLRWEDGADPGVIELYEVGTSNR